MTIRNIFKRSVSDLEKPSDQQTVQQDLTTSEKKQLFLRTKMYVILQEVMEELQEYFAPEEEIIGYLPFTNQENSTAATVGIAGMMHVKTPRGRDYLETFHELRGNRLLVFTNKKIYFMVVLEFIEEKLFNAYDYESIAKIKFKKSQTSYREWQSNKGFKKETITHYTLDFQAGDHVFTETLTDTDGQKFLALREQIPALKAIELSNKVTRNSFMDYVFSNINFSIRTFTILSWLFFGSLFLYFVYMIVQIYFFPETIRMPDLDNLPEIPHAPKIPGGASLSNNFLGCVQSLGLIFRLFI